MVFNMTDADTFLWSMLFGAVGMGYLVCGKNEARMVPLLCGLGLCACPYFVSSLLWMLVIGIALTLLPWFMRAG